MEKQTTPTVSIVIPCYNSSRYVRKCLDSILRQTLRNIEVLPVNDGSVDDTLSILEEYAARDLRVHVINMPHNSGTQWARYAGIKAATGQWIGFVDGDDYIAPDYYETLIRAAVDNDADVACCCNNWKVSKRFTWRKTRSTRINPNLAGRTIEHDEFMSKHHAGLLGYLTIYASLFTHVYNRSLFANYTPPEQRCDYGEDMLANFVVLARARRVTFVDYCGYYYRSGGVATSSEKLMDRSIVLYHEIAKLIDELHLPARYEIQNAHDLVHHFHASLQNTIVLGGGR